MREKNKACIQILKMNGNKIKCDFKRKKLLVYLKYVTIYIYRTRILNFQIPTRNFFKKKKKKKKQEIGRVVLTATGIGQSVAIKKLQRR